MVNEMKAEFVCRCFLMGMGFPSLVQKEHGKKVNDFDDTVRECSMCDKKFKLHQSATWIKQKRFWRIKCSCGKRTTVKEHQLRVEE